MLVQARIGRAIVDKSDEVVFCWCKPGSACIPWEPAKAIKWGYQKVYYFRGCAPAWKAAGYPIETGE